MTTLVVTDLDGTVWDDTLSCHPSTLAAIKTLSAHDDVELLVATGRRRNSARSAFAANGFTLPSVLLNGAIGYDFDAESIFHQVTFETDDLRQVFDVLASFELGPVAYLTDTRALAVHGVTTSVKHLDGLGEDLEWSSAPDIAPRSDVLGMSMLGIDLSLVQPALADLIALAGVEVAAYADHLYPPYSLMLAPANVTKEVGIRAYCEHAGIVPDRIIALGDGGNDLEMLAMADVAFAVKGGDQRAIDMADHIIERPEHGGWATVLDFI